MYCYTIANDIKCILRELDMWTEISAEHHTFLLKVAGLSDIKLSHHLKQRLRESREHFNKLRRAVKRTLNNYPGDFNVVLFRETIRKTRRLLERFLELNEHFLKILHDLKKVAKHDKVWQSLVQHITEEQEYMNTLFSSLLKQIER